MTISHIEQEQCAVRGKVLHSGRALGATVTSYLLNPTYLGGTILVTVGLNLSEDVKGLIGGDCHYPYSHWIRMKN